MSKDQEPKSRIPLWDQVQVLREGRLIHGDGMVHTDVVSKVAQMEAVDVGLMKPEERAEYRARLARRL